MVVHLFTIKSVGVSQALSLDEDPGVKPEAHIWSSHDVSWLEYEGVPVYQEWQPNR